ncbi:SUKH superfamily protein [Glaciihabitans tibetensis]|uniref:SUKH superfamily protein n=1 Tax=Glaciihabitans tibetensis TaxID=1266600 RepID=A0A2T0VAR2_9MICO|nr:SMI1/KNR4 family protein [Glaciihabitans tibetensis]PRY67158.1 SUKH superfamily protein [Glaciihabitans tibetensis]
MVSYDEMKATLLARDDVQLGVGASDEDIRSAQDQLGEFPPDFTQYLRDFGHATFGGAEISGLGPMPAPGLDLVEMVLLERTTYTLPERLVAVGCETGVTL